MKKQLIGALVGAIILFVWQFLTFGPLQLHQAENMYDTDQHKIMPVLSEHLDGEGEYFLADVPEGTTQEQIQNDMTIMNGKAWAKVKYYPSFELNFGMNLLRGFVIDFVAAFLLCWILMRFAELNFKNALLTAIAVGVIGYFTIPYLNNIWYPSNTIGYLIDAFVGWGLVGAWLGWYLPAKSA